MAGRAGLWGWLRRLVLVSALAVAGLALWSDPVQAHDHGDQSAAAMVQHCDHDGADGPADPGPESHPQDHSCHCIFASCAVVPPPLGGLTARLQTGLARHDMADPDRPRAVGLHPPSKPPKA